MAVVKISSLPTTAVTSANDYFVIDDAALTTTSKVQLKNLTSLQPGSGTNSIKTATWLASGATANNVNSIAIGVDSASNHDDAVVIGAGVSSTYSDTLHAENYHTNGQYSCGFTKFSGNGFLNFVCSLGNVQEIEIDGNTDFGFANARYGAVYDFIVTSSGGPWTIANWNVPGGYTLKWKGGGGIPQPTANASDIYRFVFTNNTILGEQIANFS